MGSGVDCGNRFPPGKTKPQSTPDPFPVAAPRRGDNRASSHRTNTHVPALRACLVSVVVLFAGAISAQDQQPTDKDTAETTRAKQLQELENRKREIEGRYNAAHESLTAVKQQLAKPTVEKPPAEQPSEPVIKVFTLRNIRARDAERIIKQLFPRDIQSAAADERTNSLIVRGSEEQLNVIYHILTRLDEPDGKADQKGTLPAAQPLTPQTNVPVAELAKAYEAKEQRSAALAAEIRSLPPDPKSERADKLKAELHRTVSEAFALRQQLHQAELTELRERMQRIQQNIQARSRISDAIISRRVEDLLNPALAWEAVGMERLPGGAANGDRRAAKSGTLTLPADEDATRKRLAVPRAVMEKVLARWEQDSSLFTQGRIQLDEVLQAAKDLRDAELAAAANDERLRAVAKNYDRLLKLKGVEDFKVEAGVEPEFRKLQVDSEVLKAQAELAAEENRQKRPNSGKAETAPSLSK